MSRVRPLEIKALVPLLEQDWESPEELAKNLIEALDKARASRTSYVAVMQFGDRDGHCWYYGLGPYPGMTTASNAVQRHPGATVATKVVVVPVTSPEGLDRLLREVG